MMIRSATPADLDVVVEFNRKLAAETEGKTLDRDLLRPGVRAVLADPHKGRYFVAERDGEVVGQLAITFEWSDWRNGWFWWIQSVFIREDARRQGVFRKLFEHLHRIGSAEGVIGIRLYVEKANAAAQSTYRSMGLELTDYLVMERYPV